MKPSTRYRDMRYGITRVNVDTRDNGVQYVQAEVPLDTYPQRMTDKLLHWSRMAPERTFLARRKRLSDGTSGDWEHLTYAQAVTAARRIGQALLQMNLSVDRPVVILSENSLEHGMMALACMMVGIAYCPVSPAYATLSKDYDKLKHILRTLTPGLVMAADAQRYGAAIQACVAEDVGVVLVNGDMARPHKRFSELLQTPDTPAVDDAMHATHADTVVKFLFTSGSTDLPKGVINTHRMWCANQQQMWQSMPVLGEAAPVLVDWLPWNHSFGGNHNVGLVMFHGGSLYIDDGKPVPALMHETLRNLREIAPTVYFNVPTGLEAIANAMHTDDVLRKNLLSKVRMFFYSGAALAQPIWDSLHAAQERELGQRIVMGTGLGMTETGPFGIFVPRPEVESGDLGLPGAGLQLKLVPVGDKVEVRYKGPNVTPGYWRAPEATAQAFDEEGFLKSGDAVVWRDATQPNDGLRFDGRIAEDFKLATGTFVSVGPLRARIIAAGAPYVQDAVITGLNMNEVGALLFTTPRVRTLCPLPDSAALSEVLQHPSTVAFFQELLNTLARQATGSANRVSRLLVMSEPPSIDSGEVTDKGSINQHAVLKQRHERVQAMYAGTANGLLTPATF
ncbi:MAG: feruloyl-CoA synthase [Betaproteobacteria bacterium]|nr:feruloyl-CoA synthase [Betaproteobacteria bacterium]